MVRMAVVRNRTKKYTSTHLIFTLYFFDIAIQHTKPMMDDEPLASLLVSQGSLVSGNLLGFHG